MEFNEQKERSKAEEVANVIIFRPEAYNDDHVSWYIEPHKDSVMDYDYDKTTVCVDMKPFYGLADSLITKYPDANWYAEASVLVRHDDDYWRGQLRDSLADALVKRRRDVLWESDLDW